MVVLSRPRFRTPGFESYFQTSKDSFTAVPSRASQNYGRVGAITVVHKLLLRLLGQNYSRVVLLRLCIYLYSYRIITGVGPNSDQFPAQ